MTGSTLGDEGGSTYGTEDGSTYGSGRVEHGFAYGTLAGSTYGTEDGAFWSETQTLRRRAATGSSGASTASRVVTLNRSAATGSSGGSRANGVALYARSLQTGSSGGSTSNATYPGWAVDRTDPSTPTLIRSTADLEVDPETITLPFRASSRDSLIAWRRFDRAGDLELEEGFAGVFRAIDRSGSDPITIEPPVDDRPPFASQRVLIDGYDEEQIDVDAADIELTLQRLTNRSSDFDPVDQAGGEWRLELGDAAIALDGDRVGRSEIDGEPSGGTVTLPIWLDDDQAATLMDVCAFPAAVVERAVPDGESFVTDERGSQTVDLEAPSEAILESGAYLVEWWTVSFHAHDSPRWLVEIELRSLD